MEKITFTGSMEEPLKKNLLDWIGHISSLTGSCVEIITFLFTNWYPENDDRTADELFHSNCYFLMTKIGDLARTMRVLQRRPSKTK